MSNLDKSPYLQYTHAQTAEDSHTQSVLPEHVVCLVLGAGESRLNECRPLALRLMVCVVWEGADRERVTAHRAKLCGSARGGRGLSPSLGALQKASW